MKRLFTSLAILILLCSCQSSRPWTGFGPDAEVTGRYRTIEECQRVVGKTAAGAGKTAKVVLNVNR